MPALPDGVCREEDGGDTEGAGIEGETCLQGKKDGGDGNGQFCCVKYRTKCAIELIRLGLYNKEKRKASDDHDG